MADAQRAILGLNDFVNANDGPSLNAQAILRLTDIATQAFADIAEHKEEMQEAGAGSIGSLGVRALERLKNVKADLAALDRSLSILETAAGRRKPESAYALAVGKLSSIRDELKGQVSALETESAFERTVAENRIQEKSAARARQPSPVFSFISNLFTRKQPAAEGIIVKVSKFVDGRRAKRWVRLEPIQGAEPQMPTEGVYVRTNGKRYLYDAPTDSYYRRMGRGRVEVVTKTDAYELRNDRRYKALNAENFSTIDYARVKGKQQIFGFGELFKMLPPLRRRSAPPKQAPPKLRLATAH